MRWLAIQLAVFLPGSAALLWISRKPLMTPRSHGFYRFFAWEAIAALTVLNLPVWFRAPFSLAQLISWALLLGSAFLVVHAVRMLRAVGHAEAATAGREPGIAQRSAVGSPDPNYAFENTSYLVRAGAYRFIRHPMYASLLYLAWGVYLKDAESLPGAVLALAASVLLWLTARADEEECTRVFGPEYTRYMAETRRFIPYLL